MSGIAGIIRFDGGPVAPGAVEAMTAAMAHRGGDGIGHWRGGEEGGPQVALGHCQTWTTPEARHEVQPLVGRGAGGTLVLVMAGRLDNRADLIRRLRDRGAAPEAGTHSDTPADPATGPVTDPDLVLAAYRVWGPDCAEYLDGDYALVIWDGAAARAFCLRDRMGMKPFFHHWDGRRLVFASELRVVLEASGVPRRINQGVLAETLAAEWVSRDETLWQGIERLVAARRMVVGADGPRIDTYWHPETIAPLRYKSDGDYAEHYREVLFDCVARMSRALGPVGYEVSGGLDSSALFAVADSLCRAGDLQAPDLRGYTLGFAPGSTAYELDFARAVGAHLGRAIEEVPPEIRDLAWFRDEAAKTATIPNFPNGIMHLGEYLRHREAGGRVLVDGVGGDQMLAGGQNDLAESLQTGAWGAAGRSLRADLAAHGPRRMPWRVLRHGAFPLMPAGVRDRIQRMVLDRRGERETASFWLSPPLRALMDARHRRAVLAGRRRNRALRVGLRQRLFYLDHAYAALGFEITEAMAAATGVEQRSPYFSTPFIEMALAMPLSQLRRGRMNRWVHREVMRGLLPEIVRTRTSKAEFALPFQGCIEEMEKMPLPPEIEELNWINTDLYEKVKVDMRELQKYVFYWPVGMLFCLFMCHSVTEGAEALDRGAV